MNLNRFDKIRALYDKQENYLANRSLPKENAPLAAKIGDLFCPGPYYYYVLDSPTLTFDTVSDSLTTVLGHDPETFSLQKLLDGVHPEDFPFAMQCETRIAEFIKENLVPDKLFSYKYCYSFRQLHASGVYRNFMMQTSVLRVNEEGALLKVFGVHTDITDYATPYNRNLYFTGLNGTSSCLITDVWDGKISQKEGILEGVTARERQVLGLLSEGNTTEEIADILHISRETVISHRKNLLRKTNSKNTVDLVARCIRSGWI